MSIKFDCPRCHKPIRAADELARRGVHCPRCRSTVRVPPAEFSGSEFWQASAHQDDTYELADPPVSPWAYASASLQPAAGVSDADDPDEASSGASGHRHARKRSRGKPSASRRDEKAADSAASKRMPRLMLLGVAVSPMRAAVVLTLVVLACVAGLLGYRSTLGQPVRLVTAQPVRTTVLLDGLTIREGPNPLAASIVSNTGLGQGPASRGGRTLGGDDRLVTTRPASDGDRLLVEAAIQVKFLRKRGRLSNETATLRASDFELVDPTGRAVEAEALLTERFGATATLGLGQASGPSYRSLLPPGHEPTQAVVSDSDARAPARGTLRYRAGSGEVEGRLSFTDRSAASGRAPGVRGFDAYGRLRLRTGDGEALYLFEGDRLRVKLPHTGEGWWATERETHGVGASPFERIRATLLFDRPDDPDARQELHFANRKVATLTPSRRDDRSSLETRAPLPPEEPGRGRDNARAASESASKERDDASPGLGGYFDAMIDARDRAKGLAMESTLRQLNLALQMYLDQHDQPPRVFEDLAPFLGVAPATLQHPRTGETPGFVYVAPPDGADPDATPVIFEARDGRPDFSGGRVYLSGRIERGVGDE